jgi:hypothetical protein
MLLERHQVVAYFAIAYTISRGSFALPHTLLQHCCACL